ncbi:MAG: SIS domain-containing protein [Hyphomicrobiales bacterium]
MLKSAKLATEKPLQGADFLASARRTVDLEARGLAELGAALSDGLGDAFVSSLNILRSARGRVIVTGMGKSGHVAQKTAATFASTGTPAFFVHPSEASHGDLGMITRDDVVLAFSWSGETVELTNILTYAGRFAVPLIAVTSRAESTLARAADVALVLPQSKEACPNGLAPTTSTVMQLSLADCLAMALLEARGFTASDFKTFHPGGQLGARLKFVSDLMHEGDRLPLIGTDVSMSEAIVTMSEKSFGCLGIVSAEGELVGIITDGDLRRHMDDGLLSRRTGEIMTCNPKTVTPGTMASAALELINSLNITSLFVIQDRRPVGLIHVHDILRAGVA